ncbi:F-box only protein 42 [Toxorhynchites rutilus septentrionalis]|uniref:F-box only protein 42 n=1 Tax=Toxorhynchites rutilus septentrionalis TaxID=329112 RepID=UPI002478DF5A|nr:F-box only protein 42 [Toxorhynchites rutilus septentrionalis]
MATVNDLPNEILEFIFSLLPPYLDLEQCALVCKRWIPLINNVRIRKKASLQKGLMDFNLCWRQDLLGGQTPIIAARFAHASSLHRNSMYVFGGASSYDTTFNDLWRFDLSRREWIRPISMGTYPSPKAGASLVCHKELLVLFGGWRHSYTPFQMCTLFDELHIYNLADNRWTIHNLAFGPPPMTGHSATVHHNKMIVFGGYQKTAENLGTSNDIWVLDLDKLAWKRPTVSDLKPPPRFGQFQMAIGENHILVLGGTGGVNRIFNDAWLLDMRNDMWRWKNVQVRNKKNTVTHNWIYPTCSIGSKIIVLSPTSPNDFQITRQHRPTNQGLHPPNLGRPRPLNPNERNRAGANDPNVPPRQNPARSHPPPPPPPPAPIAPSAPTVASLPSSASTSQRPQEPRPGPSGMCSSNSPVSPPPPPSPPQQQQQQQQQPTAGPSRSQPLLRSPQLYRQQKDDEHMLPKRFNASSPSEPNHMTMVAFTVPPTNPAPLHALRERQLERLRKIEEKISAMRRIKEQEQAAAAATAAVKALAASSQEQPVTPKRVKRNGLAVFVCDISRIMDTEPVIEWQETRNSGLLAGAPDHFTFSTMVSGNGELIVFGGLNKNPKSGTSSVTNSVHFLTVPTAIV